MTTTNSALDLLNAGYVADALPLLRDEAFRSPSYQTLLNYGIGLRYAGEFDKALCYLAKCVALDPTLPNAFLALGNTSTDLGEWTHALGYYEGAFVRVSKMQASPAAIRQVAMAYAQALLRDHRFQEAWPLWELARFERSYWALPGTRRWLGEPCKSLLVVCEGGFGDAMLFARWLPFARSRTKYLALLIWDRMAEFRDWHALGVDVVLLKSEDLDAGMFEYTTSFMSLPAIAGMKSVVAIPGDYGFRRACFFNPARVGFCWRAEESSQIRRSRSLPDTDAEQIAASLSKYSVVTSLVPSKGALYGTNDFAIPSGVVQDDSLLDGWVTTAATIRSCKFVVTVDTAVAHLAGLCGVPTLLLLPCSSDWKYGTIENQPADPWYGPHVRYYRNADPLRWNIEEITACTTRLS